MVRPAVLVRAPAKVTALLMVRVLVVVPRSPVPLKVRAALLTLSPRVALAATVKLLVRVRAVTLSEADRAPPFSESVPVPRALLLPTWRVPAERVVPAV